MGEFQQGFEEARAGKCVKEALLQKGFTKMGNIPLIPLEIKYKDLTLHEKIGQGQNAVYRVTWKSPEGARQAAAKNCSRFKLKEVEILSQLRHANIIDFFGCVREPLHEIILTELASKGSLYDFIRSTRPLGGALEARLWRRWAAEGARALNYIHTRYIQHGDIKSPNFVVMKNDTLKLCDLGTAKEFNLTVETESVRGSWPWMAPEAMGNMADSPKVTTKSDIYSFGVVLWEMLTGQKPFSGQNQLDIFKSVCERNETLPLPDTCCDEISCLMSRCWDAEWAKRPQTAEVLAVLNRHQTAATNWTLYKAIPHLRKIVKTGEALSEQTLGVVSFPSGEIVVADRLNKLIAMYRQDGKQKHIATMKSEVCGIASVSSGELIVTNNTNRVTTYNADTTLASEFIVSETTNMAGSDEHAYLQGVTSVAISRDEQFVYLGDTTRNVVTKHNRKDGALLRTFQLDIKPNFIATNSKNHVIVSGGWLGKTICLDDDGAILFTLTPSVPPEMKLYCGGACWDASDEVYLSIFLFNSKQSRIHHYNSKGEFISCIVWDLDGPSGITFTEDGTLTVADRAGVKLFRLDSH